MGICGGYQILGRSITDPHGIEGDAGFTETLGMLEIETVLEPEKCLANIVGTINGTTVEAYGYEIHNGRSSVCAGCHPFISISTRNNRAECDADGVVSSDGKVMGTYFHGIFDEPAVKEWFLTLLEPSWRPQRAEKGHQESYELLADHFRQHLDLKTLFNLVGSLTDAE